jgi:hypothetical protein
MRLTRSFLINLPKENIDLYRWVTEMTPADYESYSKAHRAMGSFFQDGEFHMVNVENIGNEMIVQHYQLVGHRPDRIVFYSKATNAYVLRWFPATVGVPWVMELQPVQTGRCKLVCTIGADFPNVMVAFGAFMNGLGGFFLRRHLTEEGAAFACDIERKFAA